MHCLGRRERFRMSDGIMVGFSIVAASGLVTFFLLDTYDGHGLEREADEQLVTIAERLKSDLAGELDRMTRQLQALGTNVKPAATEQKRERMLESDGSYWDGLIYPYFDLAIWVDEKGDEKVKWTSAKRVTPFINIADRSVFSAFAGNH